MAISKLCSTLSGVEVPLLTITDFDESQSLIDDRKFVIISGNFFFICIFFYYLKGRIHPGETNGSWMMQVAQIKK